MSKPTNPLSERQSFAAVEPPAWMRGAGLSQHPSNTRTDAQIIRDHYSLALLPDARTIALEIANLRRKQAIGVLDDRQALLYAALNLSQRDKRQDAI